MTRHIAGLASTIKSLAQMNKSPDVGDPTKEAADLRSPCRRSHHCVRAKAIEEPGGRAAAKRWSKWRTLTAASQRCAA
jgi:hypothetical protein